jgi:hypothetical protein
MSKKSSIRDALFALLGAFVIYIGFFIQISQKPNQVGFWALLLAGISIGVALTKFIQWWHQRKPEKVELEEGES